MSVGRRIAYLLATLAMLVAMVFMCFHVNSDGYKAEEARKEAEINARYAAAIGPGATPEQVASVRYRYEHLVGHMSGPVFAGTGLLLSGTCLALQVVSFVQDRKPDGHDASDA